MALPSKRRPAALTLLLCSCLLALGPASATAARRHHSSPHKTSVHHAHHARLTCAARGAKVHRRAHAAPRRCHESARKPRRVHHARPRTASIGDAAKTPATTAHPDSAQEVAAKIAAVLATPCENTELTPAAGNTVLVRDAILCLVNHERAHNGRSPLSVNARLEQAAEGHCTELVVKDYFAHVSPSGETPAQRILASGYLPGPSAGYALGENLAWGTLSLSTPKAIVAAWIDSPEHLANMLESQYTETGIGVTPAVPASLGEGQTGASYAQEFGAVFH
ncbi:MAG TPA: CAP domain-containing protein [Solirubrobacteraceae bacterium]|nr:CAP domain-containing protein [Solirubrobacteraceae bacterium]